MTLAVIGYIPLLIVLVLAPPLGALWLFIVALVFDAWDSRTLVRSSLAPLRSRRAVVRGSSWAVTVFLLATLGTAAGAVATIAAIPVSIGVLAWWVVWHDRDSASSRILKALVICVATPVALVLWFWQRAAGWMKVAILTAIITWVETYGFLLLLWILDSTTFGTGRYWFLLELSLWVMAVGTAFALAAAVRFAAVQGTSRSAEQQAEAGDSEPPIPADVRFLWTTAHPRLAMALSLVPRLGIWSVMQFLFLIPWILIVTYWQRPTDEIGVFVLAFIAVLPLAVTAVIALMPSAGTGRTLGAWIELHLSDAAGSALLLGLAITVTFAFVTASSVVSTSSGVVPIAVTALMAGLSMSLSIRLGQRLRYRTRWTYAGTVIAIALLTLMTVVVMIVVFSDQSYVSPDDVPTLLRELRDSGGIPLVCVAGTLVGLVIGSWILDPGLRSFAASLSRVKEMLLPLVGFVAGYVLIVTLFGASYYAVYQRNPDLFTCAQAEPTVATLEALPCSRASVATEGDFMYFSINTALPLGYSRIKPADDARGLHWATAAELVIGTSWIVIVFAAMLHALQERMIRKTTEAEIKQLTLTLKSDIAHAMGESAGVARASLGTADTDIEKVRSS